MNAKKVPRSPARPAPPAKSATSSAKRAKPAPPRKEKATKPPPAGVRKKDVPTRVSKGAVRVSLPTSARPTNATKDVTFDGRVKKIERGEAEVVKNTTQKARDPFALGGMELPDIGELGDIEITLPTLGKMPDPIAEEAANVRVFGPDLDESPVSEDDDSLTNEDQEALRLAELHGGFRARMEAESKRRELATDTEYWFTVVFQDRDQKDQFLRGLGFADIGDKYIDGEELADHLGIKVDKSQIVYNIGGADPKLVELVGIDPDYGSEPDAKTERKRKRR